MPNRIRRPEEQKGFWVDYKQFTLGIWFGTLCLALDKSVGLSTDCPRIAACTMVTIIKAILLMTSALFTTLPSASSAAVLVFYLPSTPKEQQLIRRSPTQRNSPVRFTSKVTVIDASGHAVGGLNTSDFIIKDNNRTAEAIQFQAVNTISAQQTDRLVILLDSVNNTSAELISQEHELRRFLQNNLILSRPIYLLLFSERGIEVGQPSQDGPTLTKDLDYIETLTAHSSNPLGEAKILLRFTNSVLALHKLAQYLGGVPGSKTVLWLGRGWPSLEGPEISKSLPVDREIYFSDVVDLTDSLTRAGITISNVANPSALELRRRPNDAYLKYTKPPSSSSEADSGNLMLQVLSTQSGGEVFAYRETLSNTISTCIAHQTIYYLITLAISSGQSYGTYHRITIQTHNQSYTILSPYGYYVE